MPNIPTRSPNRLLARHLVASALPLLCGTAQAFNFGSIGKAITGGFNQVGNAINQVPKVAGNMASQLGGATGNLQVKAEDLAADANAKAAAAAHISLTQGSAAAASAVAAAKTAAEAAEKAAVDVYHQAAADLRNAQSALDRARTTVETRTREHSNAVAAEAKAAHDARRGGRGPQTKLQEAQMRTRSAKRLLDQAQTDVQNQQQNLANKVRAAELVMLSQPEWDALVPTARNAYKAVAGTTERAVQDAQRAIEAYGRELLYAMLRQAARTQLDQHGATLGRIRTALTGLDREGVEAMNAVKRAILTQRVTDQTRSDLLGIAVKLGFLTAGSKNSAGVVTSYRAAANIPGQILRSNFGVCVGDSAALVAGVASEYCLQINLFPENGRHTAALVSSIGLSVGKQAGASVSTGIVWSPGSVAEAGKSSIGIGVEGTGPVGGELGLTWSTDWTTWSQIPAFEMGVTYGGKLGGAIGVGHETKLMEFR